MQDLYTFVRGYKEKSQFLWKGTASGKKEAFRRGPSFQRETAAGADDFGKAGSLCHGWSAIPIYFYYRYLLGIIPGQEKREPVFCGIYDAKEEREDYLKASY